MVKVATGSSILLLVLLLPAVCYSQLPSSRCDSAKSALEDCTFLTHFDPAPQQIFPPRNSAPDRSGVLTESSEGTTDEPASGQTSSAPVPVQKESFHWRRALTESFTFLLIEQAYVVHTDFYWVVSENGIPFNHYWRDYKQSLSEWTHSGWNDGDPNWFGYVGHPIQGALTGFIEIQTIRKGGNSSFPRPRPTGGVA